MSTVERDQLLPGPTGLPPRIACSWIFEINCSPRYSRTTAGIASRVLETLPKVEASYPYSTAASFAVQLGETAPIRPGPRDQPVTTSAVECIMTLPTLTKLFAGWRIQYSWSESIPNAVHVSRDRHHSDSWESHVPGGYPNNPVGSTSFLTTTIAGRRSVLSRLRNRLRWNSKD